MTREGYIEKVIYANEENGYAVFSVDGDDGEEIFVGTLFNAGEGLYVVAEGDYVNHPQYDVQFKFTSCIVKLPEEALGIEKYLASGIVKGIGEVLAKRIVKKFKSDTLRIIEEEPERLAEVNGISERKARSIAASYAEKKEFQDVIIFLSQYGISVNLAMKIYNEYGDRLYKIVKENPYRIAEDVPGVGFKIADDIARKIGISSDSEYRLRSAVIYVLNMSTGEGHIYLPKDMLIRKAVSLTRETPVDITDNMYGYAEYYDEESASSEYEKAAEAIERQLFELAIERKIIVKEIDDEAVVYTAQNYYLELNTARRMTDLQIRYEIPELELNEAIAEIEKQDNITLEEQQREAVKTAVTSGVAVITGGPGTGKTTIIQAVLHYYARHGMEIRLCAPTGRAAKRMTESTGWPAQTIHRLLEFNGVPEEGNDRQEASLRFGRNPENPLECDAIIVDEMSMVDNFIFYSLLNAITEGTRLILVGDANQLPSVGAGNVLKDIIASGCFPVTELTRIFRQKDGSDIVYNAHKINKGEHLEINNKSKDFFFIPRNGAAAIIKEVNELIGENLPAYLGISPQDIQVLTPMRKYEVGVENMNEKLQKLLNPQSKDKAEHIRNDVIFRTGDKIMQIKNNYKKEWKIFGTSKDGKISNYLLDEGVGVFNGDMGTILDVSDYDEEVTVLFDDGRQSVYGYNELQELEHAFAITIHKSQGSEYAAVILPILTGPKKLMNRNLLYTAITRAKRMVVLVGNINLINQMVDNVEEHKRYTSLDLRLMELA